MVNIMQFKPLNTSSSSFTLIDKGDEPRMYRIDYIEIGKRIRTERRKQELTQEKLSELADISESFLGHVERGGRVLSVETLAKLANALGISVEYIIAGEHSYRPDTLPEEVHNALGQMTSGQRRVFMGIMQTLAANPDTWPV